MTASEKKINVIHFQRKPRQGFNFSIEQIFKNVRSLLNDRVNFSVKLSGKFNDGYFSKFWNITEAALRQKKHTINHITGEVNFLNLLMRKEKVLLTVLDCRYVERKKGLAQYLIKWLYLKAPVKKAIYISTISEVVKQDIIRYTKCKAEKINVIPVSVNNVYKPSPKKFDAQLPVILQVGAGENKNILNLAEALKDIACKLVIIGKPADNTIERLKKNNINYTIKYNLSDEDLYYEYVHSDIIAFVSTFEGFGMPIIEANSVERVVITSNISSMPEVANDAACLVNPYDIADIKKGLLKIINDEPYREQLIVNGRKNKLRFDEQTIADAYYDLYKKIAGNFN